MINIAYGMAVIWIAGYVFLLGRISNLGRLVLNNVAPGETYRDSPDWWNGIRRDIGTTTDPACLTEAGRKFRRRAIRYEYIAYFWLAGGGIPLLIFFSFLHS